MDAEKHKFRYGTAGIESEIKGGFVACFARIVAVAYKEVSVEPEKNGMGSLACQI